MRRLLLLLAILPFSAVAADRHTSVSIEGRAFLINGKPTYAGRTFRGHKVEGLLLNARLVQGVFDDLNPETRALWKYPDGPFDAERNTREFVAAMPEWRRHGLIAFTINLQGGSPQGYSREHPWINSAFTPEGELRPDYLSRLEKIIDRADELGMVVILGYFYFGQEPRLSGEAAVVRAIEAATDWLLARGYSNVLVEIANECNHPGYHEILSPKRAAELIQLVQRRSQDKVNAPARRLLVSTSLTGGKVPSVESMLAACDFVLLHGNGIKEPAGIGKMVEQTRAAKGYRGQPIVFNEDDHFEFDRAGNNFVAAVSSYAGWGYFDYRLKGEGFEEGYQSVPVDWGIRSGRKRGFFELLGKMTGAEE
jgi:hypothetical protein